MAKVDHFVWTFVVTEQTLIRSCKQPFATRPFSGRENENYESYPCLTKTSSICFHDAVLSVFLFLLAGTGFILKFPLDAAVL